MSRYVAALVYRKKVGSMARKAILAYFAERANDDGTGVWASKLTISKEVECSKQTVIDTIRAFVSEGILIEVGRRRMSNGYTVEYDIHVPVVEVLEDAIPRAETTGPILDRSNELTPRSQATGPQGVKPVDPNRPRTVLKPSNIREDDLFSEDPQQQTEAQKSKEDENNFDQFWKVYPKKAGKKEADRAWKSAIKRAAPEIIIAAAERYAKSLKPDRPGEFVPQPKNAQGWLNGDRWDDFSDQTSPSGFNEDDLTDRQMSMLREGRVPPSLKDDQGKPNDVAQHWLQEMGHA